MHIKQRNTIEVHLNVDYILNLSFEDLTKRIDVQINTAANENVKSNEAILPIIVNTVPLCAKQHKPLRGHRAISLQ